MTSQRVEGTWIGTGGYGRFRGEWVNVDYKAIVVEIRHTVLKILEQLYTILSNLFNFEQLLSNFLAYFLATF